MFRRLSFGAVPGFAPICLDSNHDPTVKAGFMKRLCSAPPCGDPAVLLRLREFVRNYVQRYPRIQHVDFYEWLEGTPYTNSRKEQLATIFEDLVGGRPTRNESQSVKSFVKSEFYTEFKLPRLINSRHDAFKCVSGPIFKAIEEVVFKDPKFIKKTKVSERPALIDGLRTAGSRFYGSDFTAFERHFVPQILQIVEFQLYRHMCGHFPVMSFICKVLSGKNHLRTRSGLKIVVEGRRMSGEMNTSLGNGFTNLVLAEFIASENHSRISGFVEGDDGIFAVDKVPTVAQYAACGFEIKINEFADPREASFCGLVFASSGQVLRDPIKFFMGFGWTQSYLNAGDVIMDQLLRAKCLSALNETPHCPIIAVLAHEGLKRTNHVAPRFAYDGYHELLDCPRDCQSVVQYAPTAETRALFSKMYGISEAAQLLAEQAIRSGDMASLALIIPPPVDCEYYAANYVALG